MKVQKVLKTIRKLLKSFRKSFPAENSHHAANKKAGCDKTRAQNQKRIQSKQYNNHGKIFYLLHF